jgi:glycosyltransferase involved in cell wall biosynthesis
VSGGWPADATVAVVGVSVSPNCGVRDHARLLSEELERSGISSSTHWLQRGERTSLRSSRAQMRAWTRTLAAELQANPPAAILLHYSVFAYSHRGLPLFVHPTVSALRRSRRPIVTMLHEFAYPWRYSGWRGDAWALSQRTLLIDVVRSSAALMVATEPRAQWLTSRAWLPSRPVVVSPVFSNLPPPAAGSRPDGSHPRIGIFGYSYDGAGVSLVLDAIGALRTRGIELELLLLGAPGASSAAGERWLAAAGARGLGEAISFSGALPAQALSDELAACELVLFADPAGPSPRKTTLAGSLASGRPLVAIDGPLGWSELVRSDAARVVEPTPRALADALGELLSDEEGRDALGARGREFAARSMSVASSARALGALLEDLRRGPS